MVRLLDHAPRHQRPAETYRDTTEDALKGTEFHGIGDGMALLALPRDGARAVGTTLAKKDERQHDRPSSTVKRASH